MNFLLFFGQNLDIPPELDYFKNFWEHFFITKFDCASFAPLSITVSWKLTEIERICDSGVPWNMKSQCDILAYLLAKIDYKSFLYLVFLQNIFHWSFILNIYAKKLDILIFEHFEKNSVVWSKWSKLRGLERIKLAIQKLQYLSCTVKAQSL